MPEGDTLFRTAAGLRPHLLGREVTAARARVPGPQVERSVGATVGTAAAPRGSRLWVYRRGGRPCRPCGTLIRARRHGDLPRTTYWCPRCQAAEPGPAEVRQ